MAGISSHNIATFRDKGGTTIPSLGLIYLTKVGLAWNDLTRKVLVSIPMVNFSAMELQVPLLHEMVVGMGLQSFHIGIALPNSLPNFTEYNAVVYWLLLTKWIMSTFQKYFLEIFLLLSICASSSNKEPAQGEGCTENGKAFQPNAMILHSCLMVSTIVKFLKLSGRVSPSFMLANSPIGSKETVGVAAVLQIIVVLVLSRMSITCFDLGISSSYIMATDSLVVYEVLIFAVAVPHLAFGCPFLLFSYIQEMFFLEVGWLPARFTSRNLQPGNS